MKHWLAGVTHAIDPDAAGCGGTFIAQCGVPIMEERYGVSRVTFLALYLTHIMALNLCQDCIDNPDFALTMLAQS